MHQRFTNLRFAAAALLIAGGVLAGCGKAPVANEAPAFEPGDEAEVTLANFNPDGLPTVSIEVPSIHCKRCAASVEECLVGQPGVEQVVVDVEAKTAMLAIDQASFDTDAAIAALAEAKWSDAAVVDGDAEAAGEAAETDDAEAEDAAADAGE
ncbi:MAG: heavy metal-associated domain-containing protein [Planctomycetota bacterium]